MNLQNPKLKNIAFVATAIIVVGLLVYGKFSGYDSMAAKTASDTASGSTAPSGRSIFSAITTPTLLVELPPEPVNGTIKGVIECGASGFNSFVAIVDNQGRYKVTSKQFGDSFAYEGMTSIDEVKSGLKKYLAQMLNKGVMPKNLHFVMSSGALKEPKMKTIAAGIRAAGFVVNEVTPEQEGKWALLAAMNPLYKDKAFVVDVGSGNTKISWFENGAGKTIEASGAKYFQVGLTDADVATEIGTKAKAVPSNKREVCFLIGGVPNSLAKQSGDNSSRYIPLADLSTYQPGDDKKVSSGLNILKTIQRATGTTQFIFDNDANFTIGFLLTLR